MRSYLSVILCLLSVLMFSATGSAFLDQKGEAAFVKLNGKIKPADSGAFGGSSITHSSVRELTERAKKKGAEAIVFEINSPGGAPVASKEIHREIENLDIPTVCRMRDIATSGALVISSACDTVVADRSTLTGSLGVKLSYLEYSGIMEELGIERVDVSSGKYKSAGSKFKNITEAEKELLSNISESVHRDIIDTVSENRNLTEQQISDIRTAKIYTGSVAVEKGLVDRLGGQREALEAAEQLVGKNLTKVRVETRTSFSLTNLLGASFNAALQNSFHGIFSNSLRITA